MKILLIVYGLTGLAITGLLARNYYLILKHLLSHQDISLSMFFLSDEAVPAFRVLVYGTLLYAIIAPLAGAGLLAGPYVEFYGVSVYEAGVEAVSLVALLATLYWQRKVFELTETPSEKASR